METALTAGSAALIALLQLAIAAAIAFGLLRSRSMRSGALAATTVAVFGIGAVEHAVVAAGLLGSQHEFVPGFAAGPLAWALSVAEVVLLGVVAYYLRLHRAFGMLSGGGAPSPISGAARPSPGPDQGTGLYSIDAAMDALRRSLVSANHTGEPVAVLVVELDNLDELDRQGAGAIADEVRSDIGAVLRDQLKDSDFAANYGPDDRFLVVLPGAGVEIATAVARRTTWSMERLLVSHLVDVPVRVCVGIATRSLDGSDARTLVESATEMAVYARRLGGGVYARSRDDRGNEESLIAENSEITFEAMRISTQALMQSLRSHHPETAAHSERVADLALRMAAELDFPPEERSLLRSAALLHDIGMLGVSREILDRSSHLTAAQYEVVKRHPRLGYELLRGTPWLQSVATYVIYHEGVGGHGYPEKLEGKEIPLAARIIAVAEAFDSMRNPQPFRKALSAKETMQRIRRGIPMQFDADVVAGLVRALNRGGAGRSQQGEVADDARVISVEPAIARARERDARTG